MGRKVDNVSVLFLHGIWSKSTNLPSTQNAVMSALGMRENPVGNPNEDEFGDRVKLCLGLYSIYRLFIVYMFFPEEIYPISRVSYTVTI